MKNDFDSPSFSLVPMSDCNIGDVAELEKRCFSLPESKESLLSSLHSELALYLVAFVGDSFAGYITAYVSFETADVISIAVEESFRRLGVGWHILYGFEKECERRGVTRITLEVRRSNEAARSLYEKSGFRENGVRKGYYTKPKEDAVLYEKQLEENKVTL